jgi:putative methyltransferase (TIGR04325 family)
MARAPKVSVILPCYNDDSFVAQAIESVLSQSFEDFELIVTDDGSTDRTADKIRAISDPRISFEALPENHGYSSVLNASIARARGELIALHCSDDVFLPGKLQRQVAALDADLELAAVFGKPLFIDKNGQPSAPLSNPFDGIFIDGLADRFAWLRFFLLHGNGLCHPTALVRRAIYDDVGGYDPLLMQLQDYDFWIRVSGKYEIEVLNEPLIAYRVLGEGLNTSWPGAETVRRTAWEMRRALRRYLAFDVALLQRVFTAEFSELGLGPDVPPRTALGLLLATHAKDGTRKSLALDLLEEGAAAGDKGIDHFTFSRLAGELDPFNLDVVEAKHQAEVEAFRASERLAAAERTAATAEQRAAATLEQVDELKERASSAESLARSITSSTTWRLMAPLRRVVDHQPIIRSTLRWLIRASSRPVIETWPTGTRDASTEQSAEASEEKQTLTPHALPFRRTAPEHEFGRQGARVTALPLIVAPLEPGALPEPSEAQALPKTSEPDAIVQPRPEWEYVPEGWRTDDPRAAGWEHSSIVRTQLSKWPEFVHAVQSTKPLGVYHEAADISSDNPVAHNFVLAFAYVLARAATGRSSLSVLDWGGGIGHYAVIARATLPEVSIDYTVLDLPSLCAAGRTVLSDVHFTSDAEECLSHHYDLIFVSGSLQYAADWQRLLRRFAASAGRWVFLSRTPIARGPSFVVVQRPHSAGGYQTEYLSRVFNREELLSAAEAAGMTLEREFLMPGEVVAAVGAPEAFVYRGFLLRPVAALIASTPIRSFDASCK